MNGWMRAVGWSDKLGKAGWCGIGSGPNPVGLDCIFSIGVLRAYSVRLYVPFFFFLIACRFGLPLIHLHIYLLTTCLSVCLSVAPFAYRGGFGRELAWVGGRLIGWRFWVAFFAVCFDRISFFSALLLSDMSLDLHLRCFVDAWLVG
ncbi:hypothetical protein BS50DRAFT_246593 [Corynespora cassiicola Philippines]|uniref:Uncharacterized protein n=1 Tax=Corynespora cassiicola Philippines TaxID=1448308 RepID=A0A2T2P3X8_CORCC|nr:hypothetical protein BS50DRAFT_246593 [Corynespora cassiicola Philippines]